MLITQVVGIFNIFVGLMLTAAFLLFFGGLVGWAIRRGVWPGYRDEMIKIMMWANAVLFTLVVLLAAVHFIQLYKGVAAFLLGIIIFFVVVRLLMKAFSTPAAKEEH